MKKEFSNVIVFNDKGIDNIIEKLYKMFNDLGYKEAKKDEAKIVAYIVQDCVNAVCVISSDFFKFKGLAKNKSNIRKIAKKISQDVFLATSLDDVTVLEKYNFNKRIYDYICFGNKEKLEALGYNEAYNKYNDQSAWQTHFVGKNDINDLDTILKEKNTYFEDYEILIDILKLYGIKGELATYKLNDNIINHEIIKREIFLK